MATIDTTTSTDTSTLPSPPFIPMPSIPNFRSIGNYTTSSGAVTRSDLVFRCGAPTGSDATTLSNLSRLGITTFYDLRSSREIERLAARMPITEYPGSTRVFCPVFLNRDSSPTTLARRLADYAETGPAGFVRAYGEILDEGTGAYRTVFEHVRDRPTEPLAVHCTAGKDRTGVLVALMLSVAGVQDEVVAAEYQLTEMGLKDQIESWIPHMLNEPAYNNDADAVRRSLSARKDSMEETLRMIKERYGGAEGYLKDKLGFSEEDVKTIKKNLVESK